LDCSPRREHGPQGCALYEQKEKKIVNGISSLRNAGKDKTDLSHLILRRLHSARRRFDKEKNKIKPAVNKDGREKTW
jgi:hypothetical protein